jgi:hypothetical protein
LPSVAWNALAQVPSLSAFFSVSSIHWHISGWFLA